MTSKFEVVPIAFVHGARADVENDFWGGAESRLVLTDAVEESALDGIEAFSHAEVLFVFGRVEDGKIVRGARHPRNNPAWSLTGVLAQRAKDRPNRLGSTTPSRARRGGHQAGAPRVPAARGSRAPAWASELMREYCARAKRETGT